jgi:hypothetical protein
VSYQPLLCFLLVNSNLKLYLVVFCLRSFCTVTELNALGDRKSNAVPSRKNRRFLKSVSVCAVQV